MIEFPADSPYYYDALEPARVLRFFRKFLRHIDGDLRGQPIEPLPWVVDMVDNIYGVKCKSDGKRRYTEVYIEVPRKSGKSISVAALSLYELCFGEYRGEVIVGASARHQAKHLFDYAVDMVRGSPVLGKMLTIYKSHIYCKNTNSSFKVASRDGDTLQGTNPSVGIVDELHVQPDSELYDSMQQGQTLRKQPLMIGITTAGIVGKDNFAWRMHERATAVINGRSQDDTLYAKIYGVPIDADWKDEANWKLANPIIETIPEKFDAIRKLFVKAMESKEQEFAFRRFVLNQWLQSESAWIADYDWMECGDPEQCIENYSNQDCWLGLDLSTNTDLTSISIVFKKDGKPVLFNHCFCPAEGVKKRSRKDKVPYQSWVDQEYMTATAGNATDYDYILKYIEELNTKFRVVKIAFDRWGASYLVQKLQDMGLEVVSFGQGYATMSPATKTYERLVLRKELVHDNNPVLRWAMGNVTLEQDASGNIKPSKKRSIERIDPAVSSVMAVEIAIGTEEQVVGNITWS